MPGRSSSLLSNAYFDRLFVNRLEAIDIKSDNISCGCSDKISYIFSLNMKNGTLNLQNNTLIFNYDDINLITFSDRPFRYAFDNNAKKSENELISLFTSSESISNSFSEDPPNASLVTNDGQIAIELIKLENNINKKNNIFHFRILNENNLVNNNQIINGTMSLFIDENSFSPSEPVGLGG